MTSTWKRVFNRFEVFVRGERRERSISVYKRRGADQLDAVFGASIAWGRFDLGASVWINEGRESPIGCRLGFGLFKLYLSSESRLARRFAKWVAERTPKTGFYGERNREYTLHLYEIDGEAVLAGRFGPSSDDNLPPLYINLGRALRGKDTFERKVLEDQAVVEKMHFVEGSYDVRFTPVEHTTTYARWPWPKRGRFIEFEVVGGGGIPIPGKGESAHDIDDDAIMSGGTSGGTVHAAMGDLLASVMRRRRQYGGRDWRPDPRPAAPPSGEPTTSAIAAN